MIKTLTQDVFKDAPEWVKSASVDSDGEAWGHELTEELKDGFLEMIAKREAQQAMNHADNARTYSRIITFLQSTKKPCNFGR